MRTLMCCNVKTAVIIKVTQKETFHTFLLMMHFFFGIFMMIKA